MQRNNIYDDVDANENRYSSINIPSHGRIPKWLEDMSDNVKRSKSVSEYYSKVYLEMNNNNEIPKKVGEKISLPSSSGSSKPNSAKHGRRAIIFPDSHSSTPSPKITEDLDDYIVPNISNIDLHTLDEVENKQMTNEQYYKKYTANLGKKISSAENVERPIKDEHIPLSNLSLNSTSELNSYAPSILDKDSGRRSRADALDDTLIFNELISSLTDITQMVNEKKTKHVPVKQKYNLENLLEALQPATIVTGLTLDIKKPTNLDNKTSDHDKIKLENKLVDKNTTQLHNDKLLFDEMYKRKLLNSGRTFTTSPNKKNRYRKFKYKQNSASKTDTKLTESKDSSRRNSLLSLHPTEETEEIFIIPELPKGSKISIDILSTWGDKYYVGMNGIELFGSDGNIVQVKQIDASDINILPECSNDPRVVSNLLDGVNRTHDDMHLWLAPFDFGKHHVINIDFHGYTELAMLRIWNYNKSRIHSYRGARFVVITLDDVPIFKGEIAQACGSISGSIESFGDTILFTTDETILEKISRNDEAFTTLISTSNPDTERIDRPTTATKPEEPKQRPYTHAYVKNPQKEQKTQLIGVHRIDLVFLLNWGKPDTVGLTGLEVLGDSDACIKIKEENLASNFNGALAKLIDNENLTTDPKHMWSVKYNPNQNVVLSIIFNKYTYVSGIRLWNYNENIEKTFAGVRIMKIFLDNKLLPNVLMQDSSFILRRAPGNIHYDYVQEIEFTNNAAQATSEAIYNFADVTKHREDTSFEHPIMPEGFVFQIVIYTTWGDQYYVGLNGIEMYDQFGRMIILTENNICAHPESVNVLPGVSGDIRTPEKLIDGTNESSDGSHSWLAPVIPKFLNRIYIVLDQPVTISVIKLWNYFKTPSRGVKEFGILVDDLLVYNGILDKATEKSSVKYRSILFTSNADVIRKERATLVKHSIDSQGTVLTNDKLRMTTGGSLPGVDQSLRPYTSVNHFRGRSALSN